jgi:hypothetical protein
MLPYVVVAPLNGWLQNTAGVLTMSRHRFEETPDHQLAHFTDDELRAVVPPEGWDDYLAAWPEAADLVNSLRAPAAPAA